MAGADDFRRAPLPADLEGLLHDLRGPLNAIVLHLQALKRFGADDPVVRASLQSVQQETERLTAMLPVAFAISALEKAPPRRLLLRAVVESAIEQPERKRIDVDAGSWPEIDGDERLLVLAMRQLIVNALEAGGDEGRVRIGIEAAGDGTVTIVVADAGSGFKTKNPKAIVKLMATTKAGHAGIGLLVAQRVARLHGGTLAFETTPQGGVVRLTVETTART